MDAKRLRRHNKPRNSREDEVNLFTCARGVSGKSEHRRPWARVPSARPGLGRKKFARTEKLARGS